MPRKKFVFLGRVLPAANPDTHPKDLHPNDFNVEHTKNLKLGHFPLYDTHDQSKLKGKLLGNFQHDDGSQFVLARVDDPDLVDDIRSGRKAELSMTHFFQADFKDNGTEVQTRIPFEVSVAKKGNRPNCDIVHFWEIGPEESSSELNFAHSFQNSKTTMSAPEQTQAAAAGQQQQAPVATQQAPPAGQQQPPAGTPAPAETGDAQADTSIPFDPQNPTQDSLEAALRREGLSGDELLKEVARLTIAAKANESKLARLNELESQAQRYEEANKVHEKSFVDTYRQQHEAQGLVWTPELETAIGHMAHEMPGHFQTVMANSWTPGAQKNVSMMEELRVRRELQAEKLSRKEAGTGSFSARDFVKGAGSHEGAAHRTGSSTNGIFTNSYMEQQTKTFQVPVYREAPEQAKPPMRSAAEIYANLGI